MVIKAATSHKNETVTDLPCDYKINSKSLKFNFKSLELVQSDIKPNQTVHITMTLLMN